MDSSDEDDDRPVGLGAPRRRKRNQDDAIYGIFGDGDDRDTRTSSSSLINKPIGFVSSSSTTAAAAVAALPSDPTTTTKRMKLSREDEERAFLGLGPVTQPPPPPQQTEQPPPKLPFSRFGRRQAAAATAAASDSSSSTTTAANPTLATLLAAAGGKSNEIDRNIGQFEAHTKGFGAKMLAKMGFKGRLGKHEQGIAKPILPTLRPRNAGLGMVNEGTNGEDDDDDKPKDSSSTSKASTAVRGSRKQNWARSASGSDGGGGGGGKQRPPRVYKTVADVSAQSRTRMKVPRATTIPPDMEMVVDMRGPHPHASTLADLTRRSDGDLDDGTDTPTGSAYKLPELQHNVRLLVSLCEADIAQLSADRKHREDSVIALEHDVSMLDQQRAEQEQEIENLQAITSRIDACVPMVQGISTRSSDTDVHQTLVHLLDTFEHLQFQYPHEYRAHNITALAVSLAFPVLQVYLQRWQPLQPDSTVTITPVVMRWRDLLKHVMIAADPRQQQQQHPPPPPPPPHRKKTPKQRENAVHNAYEVVLETLILPRLTMCISGGEWQPTQHHATLMMLLESMRDLLPPTHYQDVLYRVVLPKLLRTIRHWHPRDANTTLLHTWVAPWREHMREDWMQSLYDAVVQRLCVVLQSWQPSDVSAFMAIRPWASLLSNAQMNKLVMTAVVPKLLTLMRTRFEVNPQHQQLEPLQWFLQWLPLISEHTMLTIMRKEFWPKWLTALCVWLERHDVNTVEVADWYVGWKSVLPNTIQQHGVIHLRHALQLMNARMDGNGSLRPLLTMMVDADRPLPPPPAVSSNATAAAPAPASRRTMTVDDMTFTEVVSLYAEVNGVAFVPNMKRGRYHGNQVYVFGDVDVYLDNSCAYQWNKSTKTWTPIALEDLL